MVGQPKLTKRAAEQIAGREAACLGAEPRSAYLSFIGWRNDADPPAPAGPIFALHYVSASAGVSGDAIVECHGVKVAFNVPERLLARLRSPVLDFDGERFVFVEDDDVEPDPP